MKRSQIFSAVLILWSLCISDLGMASALQPEPARLILLTLIPNFENHSIQFDGRSELPSNSDPLDLTGLPLQMEDKWKDAKNPTWNIRGTIQSGRVEYDLDQGVYHLHIGPILLRPHDELRLIFPFVNLDYSRIQPLPDPPDPAEELARQRTHRFSYRGEEDGRKIETLDIPFTPITKKIELILTPLMGEILKGGASGFRLSGKVQFDSIEEFAEFSRHCQSTTHLIKHGDYLSANLLYTLDHPHYFGPDVLNRMYLFKPTRIAVRSKLIGCEYDREKSIGRAEAVFSGRTIVSDQALFPQVLRTSDFPEDNNFFSSQFLFKGIRGYEIRFGKIMLAPGDTITITIPHTLLQLDSVNPAPDSFIYLDHGQDRTQAKMTYNGPAEFELSLPYVPQTGLYLLQSPAWVRPGISFLEAKLGALFPLGRSWLTWIVLGIGLLLLLVSSITLKANWLSMLGWLFIAISLFYGIRGSFGLLFVAIFFYVVPQGHSGWALWNKPESVQKLIRSLAVFALVILGVYLDSVGILMFEGLSEPDLSPLTPVVLMISVTAATLALYGWPKNIKLFSTPSIPTLFLFLIVPALYDAFNKSFLALLILFAGCWYVIKRASSPDEENGKGLNRNTFGKNLQNRFTLAFGNKVVPSAILVLVGFAIVKDLSSTYANEIQISSSPLLGTVLIPLLAFVSVFLTFASIALLFILIYPFLPSKAGYIKASLFAFFLFLIFLFGIGTDDRLITILPSILVGRVIYYLSVPMLIGLYFDIYEFMQSENKKLAAERKDQKSVNFRAATGMYFKKLQGIIGALAAVFSILAPTVFASLSNEPVMVTYFDLLEKLLLLPI